MEGIKRTRESHKIRGPADAILVSDLHLTDATPVSRLDDYIEAQKCKLQFLQSLSTQNNNCPILCAGDVFDHWKASPWLCSFAYQYLPRPFIAIPGQHDLPEHSLKQYERSALSLLGMTNPDAEFRVLEGAGNDILMWDGLYIVGTPFGQLNQFELSKASSKKIPNRRRILMLHELTWDKRPSWDKAGWTDMELLNKFGEYFDLILTGDNHGGFTAWGDKCLLVNPGSMMRRTADQADYRPRCYLYYADENEVVPAHFPIERDVHTREHIDRKKERDERISAYIERMGVAWETGLSFRKNLEAFFAENSVPEKIKELIWGHLERE